MRDLLWRVALTMDKAVGGVVRKSDVQIGKPLDALRGHPIVNPNV